MVPRAISLRWISGAFEPSCRASSPTEIVPSIRSTRFWDVAAFAAAGLLSASRRLRRGEAAVRGSTVTCRRSGAERLVAWRARFSCSRRLTTSRTSLRARPERSGAPAAVRSAPPPPPGRAPPPLLPVAGRSSVVVACFAAIGAGVSSTPGASGSGASSGWGSGAGSATGSVSGAGAAGSATGSSSGVASATGVGAGSGAGSGSGSFTFLRRRITAAPPDAVTRRSVTTFPVSLGLPSFSRSAAAVSSSRAAIAFLSTTPASAARSTMSARSMPSSSASLYALMFAIPPLRVRPFGSLALSLPHRRSPPRKRPLQRPPRRPDGLLLLLADASARPAPWPAS